MNRLYKYSDDYHSVNQILTEWNPFNLSPNIAIDVYSKYVHRFLYFRNYLDKLIAEMEKVNTSILGIGYDPNNNEHHKDILTYANKIIQALNDNEIKTYGDKLISYIELSDAIENDTSDNRIKSNADLLLSAVTEYPIFNLKEPIDLLNELKKQIDYPLTYDNISDFEKKLSYDNTYNVWRKEVLSSIIEMFFWDKTKTLDELIMDISKHYKTNTKN